MEAMVSEERLLGPSLENEDYKSVEFRCHSYKARGLYLEQLQRYCQLFPREQLLILKCESFFNNPREVLRRTFSFPGVDSAYGIADLPKVNAGAKKEEPPAEVVAYLDEFFGLTIKS